MLMNGVLKMLPPATSLVTSNVTSLQALAFGRWFCVMPDGRIIAEFGQEVARVSLSARQVKAMGLMTSGTYGQRGSTSSKNVHLKSLWVNKLRAKTASLGSTLYRLTWKERTTPSGRQIPALRASAHRTSDRDFTGWPTPKAADKNAGQIGKNFGRTSGLSLTQTVHNRMQGWGTPTAKSFEGDPQKAIDRKMKLGIGYKATQLGHQVAYFSDWPTPTSRDYKDGASVGTAPVNALLGRTVWLISWGTPTATDGRKAGEVSPRQGAMGLSETVAYLRQHPQPCRLTASGEIVIGFTAQTVFSGPLNPEQPRWMMGIPIEWVSSAPTETPSVLRKRRASLKV
tara:strand:- start:4883 stop:5905 length:1023 start_codon:yes stop_codon:yes gene_type:complete